MSGDQRALFQGNLLFLVPHMDDEVLACGGTIAGLPDKERIHVVYATDGSRSPVPSFPWMARRSEALPTIRRREARSALGMLGIDVHNGHFLDFPDGRLRAHLSGVRQALSTLLERVQPSAVFIPFRYDRHSDHLALHRAALEAIVSHRSAIQVVEYFVYYRWRLVPGGDVRALIAPEHLVAVDIREKSEAKRRALECYASQTTRFFDWQDRPILPPRRVVEVTRSPELFLRSTAEYPGTAIFARLKPWVPVAHRLEPALKRGKDALQTVLRGRGARCRR